MWYVARLPDGTLEVAAGEDILANPERYGKAQFIPVEDHAEATAIIQKQLGVQRNSPAGSRPEGRSMYSRMVGRCY